MNRKDEICTTACNHLRFLVKSGFYGTYLVKIKAGEIYHAEEQKSLKFGGTERREESVNNKED